MALKTIHESRSSAALNQLIYDINELSEQRKIKLCIYTIVDLKRYCLKKKGCKKGAITECIAEKYTELMHDWKWEKNNRNKYYIKMFETVVCCLMIMANTLRGNLERV